MDGVAPLLGQIARELFFVYYVVKLFLAAETLLFAEVGSHFHVDFIELLAHVAVLHQLPQNPVFRGSQLHLPELYYILLGKLLAGFYES